MKGRLLTAGLLVAVPLIAASAWLTNTSAAKAVSRSVLHVDFGTRTTLPPRGYVLDHGQAFSSARGFGWEKASNSRGFALTSNGVRRTTGHAPDRRYATFMQMQAGPARTTPAQWQAAVPNGVYKVTVAVGDAAAINSLNRVVAQPRTAHQVVLVGGFKPTTAHHFFTVTKPVRVTTGRLTLSPAGGKNTKIDFVTAIPVATPPPAKPPTTVVNLAAGGTVSAACHVTGFTSVLPNTAGNQCLPSKIAFVPGGLQLTSTSGQLANDDQQNALYRTFNASKDFTVTARMRGPINQLTANYQQAGAFFGPDQNNFVKVEAEHNGPGAPHLTMFYRESSVAGVVDTISLPALTSATTVDLIIRARSHHLTVYYSLNGAAPVQVGTAKSPANASTWFAVAGKTGVLVSNSGSPTAITATFTRVTISSP